MGPWTTVAYFDHAESDQFGAGEIQDSTFFWNFSNKWLSDDGTDFVLVFTGVGENDSWNTVEGRFAVVPEPASSALFALGGIVIFGWARRPGWTQRR